MPELSYTMCHMSFVTCQLSSIICHVSPVTFFIITKTIGQNGGASLGKFCDQRGLPRLVFFGFFSISLTLIGKPGKLGIMWFVRNCMFLSEATPTIVKIILSKVS